MRLTLRTLLAYLDDILDPPQAKEIGQKIGESAIATDLINRIRDVLRRRRLLAPDVRGPNSGIDPNIVAEYLDNTLTPDGVAEFERVCLASDVNLAEAAASHQILALVLGEPVEVAPRSRERMYVLGPGAARLRVGTDGASTAGDVPAAVPVTPVVAPSLPAAEKAAAAEARTVAAAGAVAAAANASSAKEDFRATIPDYLRERPLWQRAMPVTIVAVIAVVWVGLIYFDPSLNFFRSPTDKNGAATDGGANGGTLIAATDKNDKNDKNGGADKLGPKGGTGTPSDGSKKSGPPVSRPVTTPEPAPSGTPVAAVTPRPTGPIDPVPPSDEPGLGPTPPPVKPAVPPPPDPPALPADLPKPPETAPKPPEVAVAPATTPAGTNPPATTTVPDVPAGAQSPPLMYTSTDGVLLRFDGREKEWFMMPRRAVVHQDERIAVPEPFDASFDLERKACRVQLSGGTVVRYLAPVRDAQFGFELRRGRIVLQRSAANDGAAAVAGPLAIALRVGDETWGVELSVPGSECGIEIAPTLPTAFEKYLKPDAYKGSLYVVAGKIRFADGKGIVTELDAGQCVSIAPVDREAAVSAAAAAAAANPGRPALPVEMKSLPRWTDVGPQTLTPTVRRARTLFEKEFEIDHPVSASLPPVVKKSDPLVSELAVKCLGLTQNHAALSEALARASEHEAREQAILGLQLWLPRDPANGAILKENLALIYSPSDVDAVYRLLWGYDETDARNPVTSRQLVGWLESMEVAVRQLAFHHIRRLTGRHYDYLPNRSLVQRQSAVDHWRRHLEKDGALLPPLPQP